MSRNSKSPLDESDKLMRKAAEGDSEAFKCLHNRFAPILRQLFVSRGANLGSSDDFIQKIFTPYKGIGRLGAFFCFVKALSPDQQDPFINQRIGLAYMLANHYGRAFEHLNLSLKGANNNPLTLYGLAECCRMKRDYERALYYVKKAIAGNPNLDCAFELLEWLHGPARRFFGLFKRTAGKEIS